MSYKLSKREWDALQLAGFTSVEELLKRYFSLLKEKQHIEEQRSSSTYIEALGSDKCQINFSQRRQHGST